MNITVITRLILSLEALAKLPTSKPGKLIITPDESFAYDLTEAVKHLKEAIDHAKKGHADVGTKHTEEAMSHMRQSIGQ